MINKLSFVFSFLILLVTFSLVGFQNTATSAVPLDIYAVPAITDYKLLPTSQIPSYFLSDSISIKATPGEFEPVSFVIHANTDINSLAITSSDLTGNEFTIPGSNVDIRIVKCWYQGGYLFDPYAHGKYLTPELLLKDDSLIKVTGDNFALTDSSNPIGNNYLKLTNGIYEDISSSTIKPSEFFEISILERPVKDSPTLQPVNIREGYNKQIWVTIHVPEWGNPGNYTGIITLKEGLHTLKEIKINLQVLPIILSKPSMEYSIYYRGRISDQGTISSELKTKEQYTAEMKNLLDHGVTNPHIIFTPTAESCVQIFSIRNTVGMNCTNLYITGLYLDSASEIPYYRNVTAPYAVKNIYVYGLDEQNINDPVNRTKMTNIHNSGGKVMNAQTEFLADLVADILDLAVVNEKPSKELAHKYHKYGHKVFSYGNPQVVPEYPRLFRLNYGLSLWQNDYDGAMVFAYQCSYCDIWNDFDHPIYRDHVFAYPTMNGVIDTVQWEGFREGVDDVRYMTTLQNTILEAKAQGKDTTEAERYIENLKTTDLTDQDLDVIRSEMTGYILELQN
ncbi:hypothetical protein EQO05_01550 [Methanosarcina sp. MSH10X1]|uniref:hypothetical protein n=1 Tax=Methanosarcina sp. MSH10X1 TaxID=2507075 RepID=UPI000FFBC9A8|nr:hypothetical protein [Methanosarcina sp. MSH10X1]RXA21932.1 hypothetical protein EQO05_01550 [Methanosarcina sp. MSH10X1]